MKERLSNITRKQVSEFIINNSLYIAGTNSDYDSKVYVGFLSLSRNF